MDAMEYLKSIGPNPLTPVIIRMGFIKPGIAYEVSMDYRGIDGEPLWALTVAQEQDGEMRIDHGLSQAMKTEAEVDEYILELIQRLDPEGFEDPDVKIGPGLP